MRLKDALLRKRTSKNAAKDRLRVVLVSDRANCSPDTLEMMKNDMIAVISKYVEINTQGLDIQIVQSEYNKNGTSPAICANIPIKELKSAR